MSKTRAFFVKYKVFLTGLAGAVALSLNQLLSSGASQDDLRVYLYAAGMAILSYVATQWRGQGVSLLGIIGTLSGVFVSLQTSGTFTWTQFGLYGTVALLAIVAPPPKPLSYEHNPSIVDAKTLPSETVKDESKLPIGGQTIKPSKN
jgi:hypothetical protein